MGKSEYGDLVLLLGAVANGVLDERDPSILRENDGEDVVLIVDEHQRASFSVPYRARLGLIHDVSLLIN